MILLYRPVKLLESNHCVCVFVLVILLVNQLAIDVDDLWRARTVLTLDNNNKLELK